MTVTNAVKGVKNVIRHKEEFIKGLDDMTKGWEDECAKRTVDAIKDFMTKDIGAFEWILGELKDRKPSGQRLMMTGRKKIES